MSLFAETMPAVEPKRTEIEEPDQRPGQLAKTILARPLSQPKATLERIRSVWRAIAKFGYAYDVDVEIPDSENAFFADLPEWYRELAQANVAVHRYVYDRDWIWWSSTILNDCIKIDIRCDGMPTDTYPLIHLLESCRCSLIYDDMWIDTSACAEQEQQWRSRATRHGR